MARRTPCHIIFRDVKQIDCALITKQLYKVLHFLHYLHFHVLDINLYSNPFVPFILNSFLLIDVR